MKLRSSGFLKSLRFLLVLSVVYGGYQFSVDETVQGQIRRLKLSDFVEGEPDHRNLALGSSTILHLPDGVACGPWHNRGIGNATSTDLLAYISTMPRSKWQRVLLYTGDNDIAFGSSTDLAVEKAIELIQAVHDRFQPEVLYVLPVKTSPGRVRFADAYQSFNRQLADFAFRDRQTVSLLVDSKELDPSDSELYSDDGIHLTSAGYAKLLAPLHPLCRNSS